MCTCRLSLLMLTLPVLVLCQQGGAAASGYKAVLDWPDLSAGWNFGEVAGVATNAQGHVFVFHRGPHPIMEFRKWREICAVLGRRDFLVSWGK